MHKSEKLRKKLSVLWHTNVDKVKIFYSIHNKVALLSNRCSEWGIRNCHQRIFRKIWTIRKRWSKDEIFMTLKLILDFLFTYMQIFLNILEYIWWSLQSSILFMGMSKRWSKVICVVKLTDNSYNHNPNIKPEIFQI